MSSKMDASFDFRDLFVLDMANNHQGSVEHGTNIIRQHGEVINKHGLCAAIKFQFRELDSFIHPSHKKESDNKHIPRFLSTRLMPDDYRVLKNEIEAAGLISMATPFDEASVKLILDMDIDIIKVASCSARDWPLLEAIAVAGKPVIFSTGGITQASVDDLVSFFDHRGTDYAIMHCVPIYPTPSENCNLSNIETFRHRYPGKVIGWSTHEDQDDVAPVYVAVSKGARMFERHVGVETDTIKLNAYSSTPSQVDAWVSAWKKARTLCGSDKRLPPNPQEIDAIEGLKRGMFVRTPIEAGQEITIDDVYFAMPYEAGQLSSGDWKPGIRVNNALPVDAAIHPADVTMPPIQEVQVIKSAVHEVKALLNQAGVNLGSEFEVEYSHHYGIGNFLETGVVIINCINREYCKKILVQLPGQAHPTHYHKRKEETFQVLWGELKTELDGRQKTLQPGDTQLVMPGVWHRFWTETGCVFEEVSTTHYNNDSTYRDPKIQKLERSERKTIVDHWGRMQLYDRVSDEN
jgi:sialic acid synthase SpsE/D-lyxose ketol-isomerase